MKNINNLLRDITKSLGVIEYGIIKNRPRLKALSVKKGLKSFAGTKARKVSGRSKVTNAFVLSMLELKYKILSKSLKNSKDLKVFLNNIMLVTLARKNDTIKVSNSIKALYVKPVLRNKLGNNKRSTIKQKGFNKFGIDTGQVMKNIQTKIRGKIYGK